MRRRGLWMAGGVVGAAAVLGAMAGAATQHPGSGAPGGDASIESMASLAGMWRAESGGRTYEEVWMAPAHGQMTGALRSFDAEGNVRMLELLTIREAEGGLEYSVRHFDAAMTPWASEAEGPLVTRAEHFDDGPVVFATVRGSESLAGVSMDMRVSGKFRAELTFTDEAGRAPIVLEFERVGAKP